MLTSKWWLSGKLINLFWKTAITILAEDTKIICDRQGSSLHSVQVSLESQRIVPIRTVFQSDKDVHKHGWGRIQGSKRKTCEEHVQRNRETWATCPQLMSQLLPRKSLNLQAVVVEEWWRPVCSLQSAPATAVPTPVLRAPACAQAEARLDGAVWGCVSCGVAESLQKARLSSRQRRRFGNCWRYRTGKVLLACGWGQSSLSPLCACPVP